MEETDYKNNMYFRSLNDGTFDKNDFIETQIQFFFAVEFFNRPMAALAAKIPTATLRQEILRNVWEEHGEGDMAQAHGETFIIFLDRLGQVTIDDIQKRALWPEIRIFNTCLTGACVLDDYMVGTAMMGMIEKLFSDISTMLAQGIIKRGWLTQNNMIHYNL